MREEINEDLVDGVEPDEEAASTPNRKPLYVASGAVGIVLLVALGFWYFSTREGGKAVPPPRSVSFGDNTSTEPSQITSEETITIPEDQLEKIGLKIETVGETLSGEAISLSATGVVQPNAYKETPVISLLGGVVRKVSAELGGNVGRGQAVVVIFSDELAAAQSRYLALQTEAQTARQNYDRTAKLVRISPVSNTELDQALATLTTAEAELEEHHKHHVRTTKLLEIGAASREEFEMATTRLRTSEANVTAAKNRYARAVQVAEINPVSRSEFEQAAVKRQTAESDLATARQRLLLFGLSSQKVNALRAPSQITSEIALTAPVSGTVTKRNINEGEVVEANMELMRVTNLSSVWVIAQVYEKDFGLLREGSGASVTADAFPGQLFRGHVTYIDPNIAPETRTAQVRIELYNPAQALKIGMYVNVAFGSMGVSERSVPTIPEAAVQNVNDKQIVFIATDKSNVFTIRSLRLGTENKGLYPVLEGLNVGDKIVTEGSFLLRAELLKQNRTQN